MKEFREVIIEKLFNRYGAMGLVLMYFVCMDYQSRVDDRKASHRKIEAIEQLVTAISAHEVRITVLESIVK